MLSCNSALLAIASEFTGAYAPYQAVELTPHERGGVFLASTDKGNVACLAFDPAGEGDETINLLPNSELIKASRGVKTATRTLVIEDDIAKVTTYRKTTSETKEIPINRSSVNSPNLAKALKDCLDHWDRLDAQSVSATAGRYNISYIQRAIKGLSTLNASVILSSVNGGPMRIEEGSGDIVVLVMPQTAEPIPPIPQWLRNYAHEGATPQMV